MVDHGVALSAVAITVVCVLLLLLVCYWCGARMLGKTIEHYIETADQQLLGVQVHIGSLKVFLCGGRIEIDDLFVENPTGFQTECLLKAQRLYLDVDVAGMIRSRGQALTLEEISLVDVVVNYDMGGRLTFEQSNVGVILANLAKEEGREEDASDSTTSSDDEEQHRHKKPVAPPADAAEARQADVILKKADVSNILVNIGSGNYGMTLAVADIVEDDFYQKHGKLKPSHVIRIVMQTLLKSVGHGVVGNAKKLMSRRCCDMSRMA